MSLKFVTRGGKYHYVFWDQPEGAPKEDAHSKHTDPYKAAQRVTEIFQGDPNATVRIELDTITDITLENVAAPPPPPPDEPVENNNPTIPEGEVADPDFDERDLIDQILDLIPTPSPTGEPIVVAGFKATMEHWAAEQTGIKFFPCLYGLSRDENGEPIATHIGGGWRGLMLFWHWRSFRLRIFKREVPS